MISNPQHICLLIVLGMLIQIVLSLRPKGKEDFQKLAIVLVFCSLAFLPGRNEKIYSFTFHLFISCVFFVFLIAILFRDRLLPQLHEGGILCWNAVFQYAVLSGFGLQSNVTYYALWASSAAIILVLFPFRLPFALKLLMYAWFLFMVVAVAMLQFRFADFGVFFDETVQPIPVVVAILNGMAFIYLGIHLTYLYILIPIPGRNQSFKSRIKDWRSDAAAMVNRLSDEQVNPFAAAMILGILGALFYVNAKTQLVSPWTLISAMLIGMPWLVDAILAFLALTFGRSVKRSRRRRAPTEAGAR